MTTQTQNHLVIGIACAILGGIGYAIGILAANDIGYFTGTRVWEVYAIGLAILPQNVVLVALAWFVLGFVFADLMESVKSNTRGTEWILFTFLMCIIFFLISISGGIVSLLLYSVINGIAFINGGVAMYSAVIALIISLFCSIGFSFCMAITQEKPQEKPSIRYIAYSEDSEDSKPSRSSNRSKPWSAYKKIMFALAVPAALYSIIRLLVFFFG